MTFKNHKFPGDSPVKIHVFLWHHHEIGGSCCRFGWWKIKRSNTVNNSSHFCMTKSARERHFPSKPQLLSRVSYQSVHRTTVVHWLDESDLPVYSVWFFLGAIPGWLLHTFISEVLYSAVGSAVPRSAASVRNPIFLWYARGRLSAAGQQTHFVYFPTVCKSEAIFIPPPTSLLPCRVNYSSVITLL